MEADTTKDLSSSDKLDQILSRLAAIEDRLETLEDKAYETRPIWERALAEILELRAESRRHGHKLDLVQHLISTQTDVKDLEERLRRLEGNQTQG
jgi:uncharacterized protein YhaN